MLVLLIIIILYHMYTTFCLKCLKRCQYHNERELDDSTSELLNDNTINISSTEIVNQRFICGVKTAWQWQAAVSTG